MPRLIGKALEYDIANTIIEDSEPERAAEAARKKETRQKRKKQTQEQIRNNKGELLDNFRGISVRDITPVTSSEKSLEKEYYDEFTKAKSPVVKNCTTHSSTTAAPDDSDTILTPITLTIRQCTPHDAEESNFKRFLTRYTLPQTTSHKLLTLDSNLHPKTIKATTDKNKKSSNASFRCLTSLSKSQLAKLSKCYVCNLTWTARKTVPTKLTHIQSCARKHGWSEETLMSVFNKELHAAEPPESNNPLPDSVIPLERSHSLLENIKDETAAHRRQLKGKAQQNIILDPTRAHSAIVERVKNLFDASNQHPGQSSETAVGFPSTQAFQPSKFNTVTQGLFARAMLEENEKREIPSTQKVESGKLDPLLIDSTNPVPRSYPIPHQPTYSFVDTFTARSSENADFLTTSQREIDKINRRLHAIQLGATNEELLQTQTTSSNVYDISSTNLPLRPTASYPSLKVTREDKLSSIILNEQKLDHAYHVDDLDARLCQIIKQNDALYERILRYEPLHFDVFLNLDGIKEMDGHGFKHKLRTFLDKHSISFYTDSALESNRRRW